MEPPVEPAGLVRWVYEEFNRTRELPRRALSDDVVWYPPADEPDNGRRRGAEAVMHYVHEWGRAFGNYRAELRSLGEHGDAVVAAVVLRGNIGDSTTEVSTPLTQVWTVAGGRVTEVREYRTTDEALRALGE